ncbi:MAG: hypothetical protein V2A61_04520 [Calditrichota bacterium]
MPRSIDNVWFALFILLAAAASIMLAAGANGLSGPKIAGMISGLTAFTPVFIILRNNFGKAAPTKFLRLFVIGFFFKLLFLAAALSIMIACFVWPALEVAATSLSFLLAGQIYEAVFFYRNRSLLDN